MNSNTIPINRPIIDKPNGSNYIFICFLTIATLMIFYSIFVYLSALYSNYYPVEAVIKEVECNSFIINNHLNEYHCVVNIEYYAYVNFGDFDKNNKSEKYSTSLVFIDNELFAKGDRVIILVNKYNPLDVKIQVMSDQEFSQIMSSLALLLISVASAIHFIKIV